MHDDHKWMLGFGREEKKLAKVGKHVLCLDILATWNPKCTLGGIDTKAILPNPLFPSCMWLVEIFYNLSKANCSKLQISMTLHGA